MALDAISGVSSSAVPPEAGVAAPRTEGADFAQALQRHLDRPRRDISAVRSEIAAIRAGDPFWRGSLASPGVRESARQGFTSMPGWLESTLSTQATGDAADPYGWRSMSRTIGEQVIGLLPGSFRRDLLAEVIPLAEFFADDADDVVGVEISLGEDERFGDFGAAREDFRQLLFERADDEPDLVLGDDVAIELVGDIGEVVVEFFVFS